MIACRNSFVLVVVVLCCFGYTDAVDASVVAQWKFEDDDFLADSSGNGNTLLNFGASCIEDLSEVALGNHVAGFDGASWLRTENPLDLSPYRAIRVSWWQKVDATTSGMAWEHSTTFVGTPGAIVADVNDAGNSGTGCAGVWCGGTSPYYNLDRYSHSYDNSWEHMSVEFDLDASSVGDVTKVFRNGELVSVASSAQATAASSFINNNFYIGARGGSSVFFNGSIDELTIEDITPDPVEPEIPAIEHESVKLYVLAGQSNMMGQYTTVDGLPTELQSEQTDVVVYSREGWNTLQTGLCTAIGSDYGPEITFGRAMADSCTDESVVLVKYAVGATTLAEDWNSTTPGELYTGLVEAVNEAVTALSEEHTVEIAGMLWMQGESDAFTTTRAKAYEANFQNFVDDIREDLATPDLPIAVGQIASDSHWTYYPTIQQAVTDVVDADSNMAAFSTDDLPTFNHHYDNDGQVELGELFADAMLRLTAIPGDANNDGKVDGSDVTILANNWQVGVGGPNPNTITWTMGDFNGDGKIDGSDVTILASNWQVGVVSASSVVPEPGMAILLLTTFVSIFGFAASRGKCGSSRQ